MAHIQTIPNSYSNAALDLLCNTYRILLRSANTNLLKPFVKSFDL